MHCTLALVDDLRDTNSPGSLHVSGFEVRGDSGIAMYRNDMYATLEISGLLIQDDLQLTDLVKACLRSGGRCSVLRIG
jgi:hypothetical protein